MNDFAGLAALVTGGTSGIGAATAVELMSRGARVAVLGRNIESAPAGALAIRCDVTQSAAVDAAVARPAETFGGLDILVNNAGMSAVGDIAARGRVGDRFGRLTIGSSDDRNHSPRRWRHDRPAHVSRNAGPAHWSVRGRGSFPVR